MTLDQLAVIARDVLTALERSGHLVLRPGAIALAAERLASRIEAATRTFRSPRPTLPDLTPPFSPPLESLTDLPVTKTAPSVAPSTALDTDDVPTKRERLSRSTPKP